MSAGHVKDIQSVDLVELGTRNLTYLRRGMNRSHQFRILTSVSGPNRLRRTYLAIPLVIRQKLFSSLLIQRALRVGIDQKAFDGLFQRRLVIEQGRKV